MWEYRELDILLDVERIDNIRYVDDTVVYMDSRKVLQKLIEKLTTSDQPYGLNIKIKKTKLMTIRKKYINTYQLNINQQQIERVRSIITYLETIVNE